VERSYCIAARPSKWPAAEAITYFVRGMGAVRMKDTASARQGLEKLASLHEALVKAKDKYWAEQVDIQGRALGAWLAWRQGKNDEAIKLMRSAAELEDASGKHVAMENRLWPMRELLGELLLELNQPAQALTEFAASLRVAENRFRSYYGAAKASERSGDREQAKIYFIKLVTVAEKSDTERAELKEAKAFLTKR
jgi:tetratricopeptide (TPR) repeat protein